MEAPMHRKCFNFATRVWKLAFITRASARAATLANCLTRPSRVANDLQFDLQREKLKTVQPQTSPYG